MAALPKDKDNKDLKVISGRIEKPSTSSKSGVKVNVLAKQLNLDHNSKSIFYHSTINPSGEPPKGELPYDIDTCVPPRPEEWVKGIPLPDEPEAVKQVNKPKEPKEPKERKRSTDSKHDDKNETQKPKKEPKVSQTVYSAEPELRDTLSGMVPRSINR